MSLTLYYHPLTSYCHKVLLALFENGTAFEPRVIDLGDADQRAELSALWPLCKFPLIHDGQRGRSVAESSIVIEYLGRHFPGPRPLIPADAEAALEVRLWDRIVDQYVHGPMQEIVADRISGGGRDLSRARATLATAYAMIDRQLAGRAWLAGTDFSLADCAAAPALFYASTVAPLPDAMAQLCAYFERLVERPSFRRVIDQARPYFPMYPFVEAMPARFR